MTTARFFSFFSVFFLLLTGCQAEPEWVAFDGQNRAVYPGEHWAKVEKPEDLGWSSERLAEARAFSREIGSSAVMIVHRGVVIDAWGGVATKSNLHSVRKSLLSGLIGIAVDQGKIDLDTKLADLGIDDNPPSLTATEKQATVGDLIKARSGVYHAALYETPEMTASKPARGSHEPGTFWHYNNWDFNALGTIYEQLAGRKIFEAFKSDFAEPLQMEDFELSDGEYFTGPQSIHPAYPFRMTARDLARFALLFLREGRWRDRQIVSKDWVAESTTGYSEVGQRAGYGYMWWTGEDGGLFSNVRIPGRSFTASGYRRQLAIVVPRHDLVVVHRVNTDWSSANPSSGEIGRLVWTILSAAGIEDIGPDPTLSGATGRHLDGDGLQRFLPGKKVMTPTYQGQFWEIRVGEDGTLERVSGYTGKITERGRWHIDGDYYCRRWEKLFQGKERCFSLVVEDKTLKAYDRLGTFVAKLKLLP